jgi:phospholipid/cholesterol/gamma-HCH transport system permease protein
MSNEVKDSADGGDPPPAKSSDRDGDGTDAKDPPPSVGSQVVAGLKDTYAPFTRALSGISGHFAMAVRAFSWLPRRPYRPRNYLEAMEYIGVGSLPIVLLVGAFTGMVTALQQIVAFRQFAGLDQIVGGTTAVALATELGPVLTSLMLAGRVGAGIAAELGTMRITEQIEALESMAVNPTHFLVLPRIVAGVLMAPILVLLFFLVGMAGAYLVSVVNMGVDYGLFFYNLKEIFVPVHLAHGLIKAAIFGFMVVLIGCYQGYNASGGGRGVGIGTNRAVVLGSVSVLVLDYFVTEVLLVFLPVPTAGP